MLSRKLAWGASVVGAFAVATAACGGSSPKASTVVRKANALCRQYDKEIAEAEAIAPGVWFTANSASKIQGEADALSSRGLAVTLAPSFVDWGRAKSLLLRSSDIRDVRKADMWLLRAKAAAASVGIQCSFGARRLADL